MSLKPVGEALEAKGFSVRYEEKLRVESTRGTEELNVVFTLGGYYYVFHSVKDTVLLNQSLDGVLDYIDQKVKKK